MAIDSLRLLAGSAARLWHQLSQFAPLEALQPFDEWLLAAQPHISTVDEQTLRRDYRRLTLLVSELEMLTRSREQALILIMDALAASSSLPTADQPAHDRVHR